MGRLHKGSKGIDESLGGLVWVRRRNGRWWPGRILQPQEIPDTLPESNSGKPIKLLAKDDVDWYNVENSKDVKAFRCGEYDECIEKAEMANSSKRSVRYASKDDAIIRALAFERACLEKHHLNSNSKMTDQGHEVEDSPRSFCRHEEETNNVDVNSRNSETESDLAQGLSSVSSEDPAYTGAYEEQTVEQTSNESEDDGIGRFKHMKGLDHLGTPVITTSKRKRFEVARVREFLKRKPRRRTVTKILESKIMVTVPVVYEELAHPTQSLPRGASNWEVSGLGSNESNAIFSLIDDDWFSDNEFHDVSIVTEEQHCVDLLQLEYNTSETAHVCGGTKSDERSRVETVSSSINSATAEVNNIIQGVDTRISKWQLKGKRSRHTNKNRRKKQKSTNVRDEFDAHPAGANCKVYHNTSSDYQPSDNCTYPLKSRAVAEINIDEDRGKNRNTSRKVANGCQVSTELHPEQRLLPYRESRCSMNSKYQDFLTGHHTTESSLFDVDLVVESNYRPQHVPYVSLRSKINGPSIIGHLLTVEVLNDGYCDYLIDDSSCELDEELGKTTTVGRIPVKRALQKATPSKLRKCGILPKKTRKLSSLTGERGECVGKKLRVEKPRGPSLACVALTIVFRRLNEALNCTK